MDMRGALAARLLNASAVTSLLASYTPNGSSARKAVYWLTRPQLSGLPAITLQMISGDQPQYLKGFEKQTSRIQLDAWALTTTVAASIVDASKAALAPGGVYSGVRFGRMFFEAEIDFEESLENIDVYRVKIDLIFNHEAA